MGVERTSLFFDIFARLKGRGLKDLERDAEAAEDALDDLNDTNKRLADSTPESIRQLRAQKEATAGLTEQTYQAKHALDSMNKGRHRLDDIVPDIDGGGRKVEKKSHGVGVRIGSMIARGAAKALEDGSGMIGKALLSLPPQAQAGIVAGAALLAIPIGAAINGAILATLSAGVVAAGVAVAAQDRQVRDAGAAMGRELSAGLKEHAADFVPATLNAIGTIKSEFAKAGPQLGKLFSEAAKHVVPLTRGLTGLVTEALPGMTTAVKNSLPVTNALSDGLAQLGETFGDSLALMSTQSDGAALALRDVFSVLAVGTGTIAVTVTSLSFLYDKLAILRPAWLTYATAAQKGADATGVVEKKIHRLRGTVNGVGGAIADVRVDALGADLDAMRNATLTAEQADLRAAMAKRQLTETIRENGKQTKRTSQGYLENRQALLNYAAAMIASAEAVKSQTNGQERSNKILIAAKRHFIEQGIAAGMDAKKVRELADALFGLPDAKSKVTVATKAAEQALKHFTSKVDAASRSRTVHLGVKVNTGNLGAIGNFLSNFGGGRALGGPVRAGRAYVVGEKGPEVIVPDHSGTVVPNNQINKQSVMARHPALAGSGGGGTNVYLNAGWVASPQQLRDEITRVFDELRRRGRI